MASKIAYIREAECIGCIKCIKACSDNAILGARKQMHTIITDLCTGCEDCIAVCPVDCIEMVVKPSVIETCHPALVAGSGKMLNLNQTPQQVRGDSSVPSDSIMDKKDIIAEAIKRTLERRGWKSHDTTKNSRDI